MGWFKRFWGGAEGAHTAAWLLEKVPLVVGTTVTATVSAWAAHASKLLSDYSPASWVFGGLIGAVLFLAGYWLLSKARTEVERRKWLANASQRSTAINPLEDVFTRQRIDCDAFRTPLNEPVADKTLIECELRGPAVVIFTGTTNLMNAGIINTDFVRVRDSAMVQNAIPFHNLTLRGGRIYNLTILVPDSRVGDIPKGAHWL